MKTKVIGIKQLHKDLPKITKAVLKGDSFIVIKHVTPVFRIEPIAKKGQKQFTIEDLQDLQYYQGDKELSKKIDQIYK